MSKLPITVCIIAKNEERYIEGCLKKLQPYGFEVIVTDTGSTDRTREIAEKYADKVLDFEWVDDFSAARNYGVAHASNNWILALDCDEYVESVDIQNLRIIMQRYPRYTGVLRLRSMVIAYDGHESYRSDDVNRFYNKNFYEYQNAIHEQIYPRDISKRNEIVPTVLLPINVTHYGYLISQEEMEAKQRRNLNLLYKSIEKNPNDAYLLFQIGQSEFILNNHEKAIECYKRALELTNDFELAYVHVLITNLAMAYTVDGRNTEALDLMKKYDGKCKTAKFLFVLASVYMDNRYPLKALLTYIKTLTCPDADTLGENLVYCYENIIGLANEIGQPDMAKPFIPKYEECVRERKRIMAHQ